LSLNLDTYKILEHFISSLFLSLVILPHVVVVAVGSGNGQLIPPFGVAEILVQMMCLEQILSMWDSSCSS